MSDEQPVEHDGEKTGDQTEDGDENRHRREDRRSLIDLTRAEKGEPERRRLPGVDRRANADDEG